MLLTLKQCCIDDLHELKELAYTTFDETFRPLNTKTIMEAYLEQAFSLDKLRGELSNNDSLFYFLYADKTLAGYIKLNESAAQSDINDPQALEIERIYVSKGFQGMGLGKFLINKAVETAAAKNKSYIWLGVWEKNEKAISFYKKNGFYEIGTHSFFMGDEKQRDYIMRKDLG